MMGFMGFSNKWREWIKECQKSASVSVLVNGCPTEEFHVSRGLRQGDPLSPLLFLIAAEGLGGLIERAKQLQLFKGVKIGQVQLEVSHIQYADDTVLLCKNSFQNIKAIKSILRNFELVSGLKVNFPKSRLIGVNLTARMLHEYAEVLNCRTESVPFKYLGVPIGANPRRAESWKPVIDLMNNTLALKSNFISFGGRVVILNSVLVGLLVYYFSFYKAPKKVINILNKIQRKFLWGGNSEKNKISWIKWDTVCKPKEEGGLNVRNLEFFNLALLTKWKWRLINDEDGLWKKIIAAKYGKIERPEDFSCSRRTRSHSTWWADLLKLKTLDNGQNWFVDGISRRLGNGTRTKFWTDIWIGDEPLFLRFCRLYRIALDKDATIFEKGEWRGNDQGWTWQWRWRRALFTWEENLLQDLIQVISTISPKPDRADSWTWKWDEKGAYTVRSTYSILTGKNNNISTTMFKKFWESEVPTKMRMFAWRAMLDRIPTRLNLLRRGVNFNGNSTNCALCECFEENSDHLFCKCTFTYQIWSSVLFWFGLECAFVGNVKDHYIQFMELFPRAKGRNEWKSIWFFVIWVIWSFRNSLIFSQGQGTIQDLIHVVKAKSWCWIKARHKNFP